MSVVAEQHCRGKQILRSLPGDPGTVLRLHLDLLKHMPLLCAVLSGARQISIVIRFSFLSSAALLEKPSLSSTDTLQRGGEAEG